MSLENMQSIKEAPPIVQQAHEIHRREMASREITLSDNNFTVNDLDKENYWFTHKKRTYSIPYPTVKTFSFIEKLLSIKSEKAIDKFASNSLAFWMLYYNDERIYQGLPIPKWKMFFGLWRIRNWQLKAKQLGSMIDELSNMLDFDRKSKSDKYSEYYGETDGIIGVSQKLGITLKEVLNMKMPAYLCVIKNLDTMAFIQDDIYEDKDKPQNEFDGNYGR